MFFTIEVSGAILGYQCICPMFFFHQNVTLEYYLYYAIQKIEFIEYKCIDILIKRLLIRVELNFLDPLAV